MIAKQLLTVACVLGVAASMNADAKVLVLENAFLRVEVQPRTGSVAVHHKEVEVTWRTDPTRGDSGRIEVCDKQSLEWITLPEQRWTSRKTLRLGAEGSNGLILELADEGSEKGVDYVRLRAPVTDLPETFVTLEYRLYSNAPEMDFMMRVSGPQAGLVTSVAFPSGFTVEPDEKGYLILPCGTGLIVPNGRYEFSESRRLYAGGGQQGYTMRFFGASKSRESGTRSAYVALLDCSLQTLVEVSSANGRVSAGAKIYGTDIALDNWRRDYRLKYRFIADGGYVEAAQCYREWVQQRGTIRTFADKLKSHPDLARLPGAYYVTGLMFYYNWEPYVAVKGPEEALSQFLVRPPFKKVYKKFADILPFVETLKSAGVRRAVFHLAGWNRFGYDGKYPDIFPANDESGGPEVFRNLCDVIRDAGYVAVPHDDVMITFEDAPSYTEDIVARQADGSPYYLGTWPGGNSYIVATGYQLAFVRRNLPLVAEAYRPNGYYLDCETNVPPIHDFSSTNPTSMEEDLRLRGEMLDEVRRYVDIIGSETIADWAARYLDYAGHAYDGYEFKSADESGKEIEGIVIPLWDLVYHDVIYGQRLSGGAKEYKSKNGFVQHMRTFLRTLRAGTLPPSIQFDPQLKAFGTLRGQARAARFKGWASMTKEQILRTLSELSCSVGDLTFTLPMTDHVFLSDDHMVERTTFGNTVQIAVNGRTDPFELSSETVLAPLGFLVESAEFVAACVTRYADWEPDQPTLFWMESIDGLPLRDSKSVRVYRAFGDETIPFENSHRAGRSQNGTELSKDARGGFLLQSKSVADYQRYNFHE